MVLGRGVPEPFHTPSSSITCLPAKYQAETQYMHSDINYDTGYPHDGRADKDSYLHDGRVDKDSYPHDRRADKDSYPHDRHKQCIMLSL